MTGKDGTTPMEGRSWIELLVEIAALSLGWLVFAGFVALVAAGMAAIIVIGFLIRYAGVIVAVVLTLWFLGKL